MDSTEHNHPDGDNCRCRVLRRICPREVSIPDQVTYGIVIEPWLFVVMLILCWISLTALICFLLYQIVEAL